MLSVAHAWTSVIFAGKRDSRRLSTSSFFEWECRTGGNKLSNVRSFIILLSGEGFSCFSINYRFKKSNRFWLAKQRLCTCVTLFCTFLCRRFTTTTWKRPNFTFRRGRQQKTTTYFSFPELWYSLLEFNSRKNCQHLTNWTSWNKRDKVWSSANSHFKWRFRSRRRCQPGYHMSGKSQTIGDFTFCRTS